MSRALHLCYHPKLVDVAVKVCGFHFMLNSAAAAVVGQHYKIKYRCAGGGLAYPKSPRQGYKINEINSTHCDICNHVNQM